MANDIAPEVENLLNAIRQGQGIDAAVASVPVPHLPTAVAEVGKILNSKDASNSERQESAKTINKLVDRDDVTDEVKKTAAPILGEIYLDTTQTTEAKRLRTICLGILEKLNAADTILIFQNAWQIKPDDKRVETAFETAVNNLLKDTSTRQQNTAIIKQLTPKNLSSILTKALTSPDEKVGEAAASAAIALGIIGGTQSRTILCGFLEADLQQQAAGTEQVVLNEVTVTIRINACNALGDIGDIDATPCLGETLRRHPHYRVRRIAASALNKLGDPRGIAYLVKAFLLDQNLDVRKVAKDTLIKQDNWQEKTNQIIDYLAKTPGQTLFADNYAIVQVMKSANTVSDESTPYPLTDYLIDLTISKHLKNEQLVARLADFIVISAGGSKKIAGERIAFYRDRADTAVTNETLQPLQIEIGGVTALDPILGQLEKNLEKYFQDPIKNLNDNTREVWRQTIFIAHTGFALRALMSVALFLIGGYLVLDSYQQFKTGDFDMAGFFGPGVSFVSGLATMLTMIFTGPLKEIRKAVSDVGMANTAFISYIHRVSQVSHTFSYYYLQGKISFKELDNAGKLIEDMTDDTVKILKNAEDQTETSKPTVPVPVTVSNPTTPPDTSAPVG